MKLLSYFQFNSSYFQTDAVGNFHTPLWYAAYMGRAPAVEVLLKYGANKNKVGWGAGDIYGTPMQVAK